MKNRIALFAFVCFLMSTGLWSGNLDMRIIAQRIGSAPTIDGQIDEVYSQFTQLGDFYQYEPQSGPPGTEKTELLLGHDDENLYVAFRCYDNPQQVYARLGKREDVNNSDEVMIYFDTFNTRRRGYFFGATPLGVQLDGTRDDEAHGHERKDSSWDGLWYSAGHLYEWGYFVEMKIPFASMRFPAGLDRQEWGMVAVRRIARKGEAMLTVKMDRAIRGFLTQASTIVIDSPIKNGKKMEIIPTSVLLAGEGQSLKPELGLSLKYGFTSNFVGDLAVNPDFSQIESDAGQININQRYALEYPEKRPFFLESKALFETPLNLFYSRRIADPDWGIKLSGQLGRSGIGFLSSYDRASFENLDEVVVGGEQDAWLNVLRYKYQFQDSNYVGLFFSHKSWNDKTNLVLSTDFYYKSNNMVFKFQGALSDTNHTKGNALESSVSYDTRAFNIMAGYKQISPEFDSQLGFLRRIDYRTFWAFTGMNFYPEKEYLRSFGLRGMFSQNFDWGDGHMIETEASLSVNFLSFKNSMLDLGVRKEREEFAGLMFDKTRFSTHFDMPLNKQVRFGASFGFGDSINYEESNPYLGNAYDIGLRCDVSSFKCMITELKYTGYAFYQDLSLAPTLKMDIYRIRNTFLFSRWLASRLILEYNSYYESTLLSLLLSYELNPGTGIHLGTAMTHYQMESADYQNNWSVFLKVSYLMQI